MASKTQKLCGHTLTGECHFGNKCTNHHPVNAAEAKEIYNGMKTKTLNLCGFHPNCTTKTCTYLHVTVLPKEGAEPAIAITRGRIPPSGGTPLRPAVPRPAAYRAQGGGNDRSGNRLRGMPSRVDEPKALLMLNKIRGKFNAFIKAETAFQTLATTLNSADARDKAKMAKEMQNAITDAIEKLGTSMDEYLKELGTSVDDDDAGSDAGDAPAGVDDGPEDAAQ